MSLTPQQQQELQKLQQMSQQLQQLHQQYLQMQARQREVERSLEALKEIDDATEVYKTVGQLMFKTEAGKVKKELSDELELLEVRVSKAKKQVEEFEKRVKAAEENLRKQIQ